MEKKLMGEEAPPDPEATAGSGAASAGTPEK
jgi:hypothetical protein